MKKRTKLEPLLGRLGKGGSAGRVRSEALLDLLAVSVCWSVGRRGSVRRVGSTLESSELDSAVSSGPAVSCGRAEEGEVGKL